MRDSDQALVFTGFMLLLSLEFEFWPGAVTPTLIIAATLSLLVMIVILIIAIKYKPK